MEQKRIDAIIYIFGYYKLNYKLPDNSLYTPIQCGRYDANEILWETGDDSGDNISKLNHFYAEGSGAYWVWKHHESSLRYIGQCQYRRLMLFDEHINFDNIFKEVDVILSKPLIFKNTIKDQYKISHNIEDIILTERIIKEKYPMYIDAFNEVVNGHKMYCNSGYVMKIDDYNEYNDFLFGVLDEFRKCLGLNTMDDVELYVQHNIDSNKYINKKTSIVKYQRTIGGFLAERLLTTFITYKFKKQLLVDYINHN